MAAWTDQVCMAHDCNADCAHLVAEHDCHADCAHLGLSMMKRAFSAAFGNSPTFLAALSGSPCLAIPWDQLGCPAPCRYWLAHSTHLSAEHVEDGEHDNELPEVHHSVAIQV